MANKKIILFIVEGINDKTSLALCMNEILDKTSVHFEMTEGDITTKRGINCKNITAGLGNLVKDFSGRVFRAKDFYEVVHLIDTDGAFVPDECVLSGDNKKVLYTEENIITTDVENIIRRNKQKTEVLNKMLSIHKVWGSIPYSMFYFSCNMDHVLHGDANLSNKDKNELASDFEEKFYGKTQKFIQYMKGEKFSIGKDYNDSWEFIMDYKNSLKRYSNFCIYLDKKEHEAM